MLTMRILIGRVGALLRELVLWLSTWVTSLLLLAVVATSRQFSFREPVNFLRLTLAVVAGHMELPAVRAEIHHELVRHIAGCNHSGRNLAEVGTGFVIVEDMMAVGNRSGHNHLAGEDMGYVTVADTAGCTVAHHTGRCTDRKGRTL
jgi:hypothetical protein